MRYAIILALGILLLGSKQTSAQDREAARKIVARSVQSLGGEELLSQIRGARVKAKGINYELDNASVEAEYFIEPPDKHKLVAAVVFGGNRVDMTTVLNKGKGWMRINQDLEETDLAHLNDLKETLYVYQVSSLLPLLRDNKFTLAVIPTAMLEGKPIDGVRVTQEGMPEVQLYFDPQTGFLSKVQNKRKHPGTGKLVEYEELLSDYREIDFTSGAERLLKEQKIGTDGPALLAYLKKHTLADADRAKIDGLIRQLGDSSFEVREKAKKSLIQAGGGAAPFVIRASRDPDPEVSNLAKEILESVGKVPEGREAEAVVRMLVRKPPEGAVAALLAYLPDAPDEAVVREIQSVLYVLGMKGGKADPALQAAVEDKNVLRRNVASALLKPDPNATSPYRSLFLPGLKHHFQRIEKTDGKKSEEWKILEVEYYTGFEEKVFDKP